ncbi:putative membrane protein [Duganella sp. 3397]|uniref:Bacterial transmembrane pair family protein n=1 Tax=Duganella phyllosphaerae TaxID=762836 RepID=A0A1E7WHD4_9BURK|nr:MULTISPECIES: PACE efflux transporter [Duganella]MDR7051679.1 putative membrane protein [Duganella sp. 3397]OEZ98050.1 bacterial transmembrane pair family protein [Duganella phyllosphaerae]
MQGLKRKIVYVSLFELFAVALTTTTLMLLAGSSGAHASVAAVASSTVAVIWNFIFNSMFEAWEARQTKKGRSVARRIAHAIGFEGGLVAFLVPLFAWWLEISLWQAFIVDLWIVVFFLVYTFLFSLAFDRIFGLPASAQGGQPQAA